MYRKRSRSTSERSRSQRNTATAEIC